MYCNVMFIISISSQDTEEYSVLKVDNEYCFNFNVSDNCIRQYNIFNIKQLCTFNTYFFSLYNSY